MSQKAAQIVMDKVTSKPDLLFCAATGNSPTGMYAGMAENKELFNKMKVVKMDEWGIIPLSHPDSCESYLKKHLLGPLGITEKQYKGYDTAPEKVAMEIENMKSYISQNGPFDICILGLGRNGHIAFNEPNDYLEPEFHKAKLAASTIQHDPTLSKGSEPAYGLCVGMKDIMMSKKIIFLITGKGKKDAIDQILSKQITTQCPATFLWIHPNVECLIDKLSI